MTSSILCRRPCPATKSLLMPRICAPKRFQKGPARHVIKSLPQSLTTQANKGGGSIQYPADLSMPMKHFLTDTVLLSWLAYSNPDDVKKEFERSRQAGQTLSNAYEVLKWVETPPVYYTAESCDAQCYLINYFPPAMIADMPDHKPILAICCRGTTSVMDWLCDAQVRQVQFRDSTDKPVEKVFVHRGFYRQFIALFSIIDSKVKAHLQSGGILLCSGHSLGSAAATLAALNYGRQYPKQVYYVGCGTPRVGNQAFADEFDKCVQMRWRVKNERDPVLAIIPPIDYTHVGQEIHLGAPDPLPSIPIMTDVQDHYISNYAENMNNPSVDKLIKPNRVQSWYEDVLSKFTKYI